MKNEIRISHKIFQTQIWSERPSWWFKVWLYLLLSVGRDDNIISNLKDSQGLFTSEEIHYKCQLSREGIKVKSVENVIRWLRKTQQIKSKKMGRRVLISVCNYGRFQKTLNLVKTQATEWKTLEEAKRR